MEHKKCGLKMQVHRAHIISKGTSNLREGLNPSHLVLDGHIFQQFFDTYEKQFLGDGRGPQITITISNAPNFTDPYWNARIKKMIKTFETYPRLAYSNFDL
jgi:hypothetical protein